MDNLIYHFDFFKAPLTFKIKGKENYATLIGVLMSLPVLLFLSYCFFKSNMIQKLNPSILNQAVVNDFRPHINFDKPNMTFAVRVADDNAAAYMDPAYFSIIYYNVFINNTSHEVIGLDQKKTKICDRTDFSDPSYFDQLGLTNATCVADNQSFALGGYWNELYVNYMRILLVPCKNTSDSDMVCKSPDEIKTYMKNKYFFNNMK